MTSKNVEHLMVVDNDEAVGFMEIENHKLEMLFIASNQRGKGLGKALLQYGMKNYDVCELTVNEQNPQAIGFYEVMGAYNKAASFVEYISHWYKDEVEGNHD